MAFIKQYLTITSLTIIVSSLLLHNNSNATSQNGETRITPEDPLLFGMEKMWFETDEIVTSRTESSTEKSIQNYLKEKKKSKKKTVKERLRMNKAYNADPLMQQSSTMEHQTGENMVTLNAIEIYQQTQDANSQRTIKELRTTEATELIAITMTPKIEEITTRRVTTQKTWATTDRSLCDCESFDNITAALDPSRVKIAEGKNLILNCSIQSKVPENVKFIFSWIIPEYNNGKSFDNFGTFGILNLTNLAREDSGNYTCKLLSLDDQCCYKTMQSLVEVYEAPTFAPALLIIGAICGSQLLLCIPLEIFRRRRIRLQTVIIDAEDKKLIAYNL